MSRRMINAGGIPMSNSKPLPSSGSASYGYSVEKERSLPICGHCNKAIDQSKNDVVRISSSPRFHKAGRGKKYYHGTSFFYHMECFKSIAGSESVPEIHVRGIR
jgi:hypothetical protein